MNDTVLEERLEELKLKEGRFRLDARRKFFTQKVGRQWHRPQASHPWRYSTPGWMGLWAA